MDSCKSTIRIVVVSVVTTGLGLSVSLGTTRIGEYHPVQQASAFWENAKCCVPDPFVEVGAQFCACGFITPSPSTKRTNPLMAANAKRTSCRDKISRQEVCELVTVYARELENEHGKRNYKEQAQPTLSAKRMERF